MILRLIFLVQCALFVSGCNDTIMIPELERRARNYEADGLNDPYVNDYVLIDQWYKVFKFEQQYRMPDSTKMPGHFSCGGYEPIYIEGTHPDPKTLTETPVDVSTCLRSIFDNCNTRYYIKIRKCGEEIQYFLVPTKSHAAYCFDPPALQTDDGNFSPAPAESEVNLGDVKVKPTLLHREEVWERDTIIFMPCIKFTCTFTVQEDFFYAVHWYLQGIIFQIRGPTTKIEDLVLTEEDFNDHHIPLGFTLKCGVWVSQDATGHATKMVSSPDYFAGIKVLTPRIDVPKGEQKTIQFQLTVPLGCAYTNHSSTAPCIRTIRIADRERYTCGKANVAQMKNSRKCGYGLKALKREEKWDPEIVHYFNVSTVFENYADRLHFRLQLMVESLHNNFWDNYQADPVQVIVEGNKTYEDKFCYSRVDPHMQTADRYNYDIQKEGEYLLYRNTEFGVEVLEKTKKCNQDKAFCTCGIIIRAGADVFTINVCNNTRFIEFLSCKDGGILKVIEENVHNYQIYTPIGTWVDVNLHGLGTYDGFMNIQIMMAPKDLDRTEGLCGYMDGDASNDLKGRDGVTSPLSKDPNIYKRVHYDFSDSWRLTSAENLFNSSNYDTISKWEETNALYCVCETSDPGKITGQIGKTICSPSQYLDCHLTPNTTTSKKCNKFTSRRKRSIRHKEKRELERLMYKAYQYEPKLTRLKGKTQEQNVSESDAREKCGNAINGSMIVSELSDSLTYEDPNAVIGQCIFDVMAGNDLSLAGVHVDAMNSAAKMKFKRDPEYVANHTDKVDIFIKNSCPGNCSQRGHCSDEGICVCDKFYHGSDCGMDEREPVFIDDMEGGGLCNLTDGDGCECFYLRTHFLLPNFTCAISAVITFIDETEENITFTPKAGDYEDIFTGLCCVPEEREERSASEKIVFSTRYDTAISNDGLNFGSAEPLHVFDSECQDALPDGNTGHHIVLKSDSCYINGMCVSKNEAHISNHCLTCEPNVSKYNWTQTCKPTEGSNDNLGVILGATFGSLASILLVGAMISIWHFKIKPQHKKRKSVGDSQTFTSTVVGNTNTPTTG